MLALPEATEGQFAEHERMADDLRSRQALGQRCVAVLEVVDPH